MVWDERIMERAMLRLAKVDRETALCAGPYDEPFCLVCSELLPISGDRLPGWRAAVEILMYHDEPTYVPGLDPAVAGRDYEADVPWSIGLTQVLTYQRCLRVYATARATLQALSESERERGRAVPELPSASRERA